MENLQEIKQRIQKFLDSDSGYATATKVALAIIAISGIVLITATAPNIFQIFPRYKRGRKYSKKQLKSAFYNLRRRGFIEVLNEKDNRIKIRITKKGKEKIKELSIDTLVIPKPKKWDKKYRVVIFDIPERYKSARKALRDKIRELGFYKLQKSVWIYPYPCEDEILFIAHLFKITPFIEILTVEELLHENKIKRFFKLT